MAALHSSRTAILFDIDGVLLRNRAISSAIEKRAVSYVHTRTKVPIERAAVVNRTLYTTYGHTHTGIRDAFGIKDTIEDYNEFVYNRETLFFCIRELARSINTCEAKVGREVLKNLREKGYPVYLFTNAPDIWADAIVQAYDLGIVPERRISSSSGLGVKLNGIKIYDRVADYVKQVDENVEKIMYVEDQFRNLVPIIHRQDWQPVLFQPEMDNECKVDALGVFDRNCAWIGRTRVVHDLHDIVT